MSCSPATKNKKQLLYFVHLGFFFSLRGSAEFVNGSFDRRGFSQARRGRPALKSGLIPRSFRGAQMEASRRWVYLIRRGGGGVWSVGDVSYDDMCTLARSSAFREKIEMILHRVVSLSHAKHVCVCVCVCVCFRHFGSDRVLVTHHRRDLYTQATACAGSASFSSNPFYVLHDSYKSSACSFLFRLLPSPHPCVFHLTRFPLCGAGWNTASWVAGRGIVFFFFFFRARKDRVRVLKHDGIDYVKRNAAQGSNRVRIAI